MKVLVIYLIVAFTLTSYIISDSDAFFEGGIVAEVPGQTMELSDNVISPEQTMFVNGTFNHPADDFTASIFKKYENSHELVLTLYPTSNEFGDFNFNFTIPYDWKFGNYRIVLENGIQAMDWEFAVRKNHSGGALDSTVYPIIPPLKQFQSGISPNEIQCKEHLILVQKYDRTPACVKPETQAKLIDRGWIFLKPKPPVIDLTQQNRTMKQECSVKNEFDLIRYTESSEASPQRLVAFLKENTSGTICLQYESSNENKGFFNIDESIYKRGTPDKLASGVFLNANPNNVSLNAGTNVTVVYQLSSISNSSGVYWINLSQLCDSLPVVVWNEEPRVSEDEIPVGTGTKHCPMKVLEVSIAGYSGLELKYHSATPT